MGVRSPWGWGGQFKNEGVTVIRLANSMISPSWLVTHKPTHACQFEGLCSYCSLGWPGVADKEDGQFPAISRLHHPHLFLHNPPPLHTHTHLISDISYTYIRFYYWGTYNPQEAWLNLKNEVISWNNKSTKVGSQHSAKANNTASQLFLSFSSSPAFFFPLEKRNLIAPCL